MRTRGGTIVAAAAMIVALGVAGCGGGSPRETAARRHCVATVGFEGPLGDPVGKQQLAFARLAVANDNAAQHTRINLAAMDTARKPSLAATAADHFAAQRIVAVVGPASNPEVQEIGSVFARAGLTFISPSATGGTLTDGSNPTFFRVVPSDDLQGAQMARFVARLRPRGVMLIDDQAAYSRQLVRSMAAVFRVAKVPFVHQTAVEGVTPLGSVASRITPAISTVVLAWHDPTAAHQLSRILVQQRKVVSFVAPDLLFAPGRFTLSGANVASPAPDITALRADARLTRQAEKSVGPFGIQAPPAYAAAHVIDLAVADVCRSGRVPSRSGVLAAVRATNEPSSILGVPIRFRANGNLAAGRWFMFRIEPGGHYAMLPGQ